MEWVRFEPARIAPPTRKARLGIVCRLASQFRHPGGDGVRGRRIRCDMRRSGASIGQGASEDPADQAPADSDH
ncbi:hypothetical protein GCM10009775_22350 [Microbacterium aoyamense]|uniref:Uncharacterized protein n=1 Tax=Microbacterium aoyamense TaxID=344166 RepID=A0ABN2PR69_9MICO